jgi:RNA polymerase sigma factor (sigma-70 family)
MRGELLDRSDFDLLRAGCGSSEDAFVVFYRRY